ncbi:MAG: cation-translocating P-type ATPase [Pseudomonadota bacterium]|uniref:cation-translocating P-type ATPase n=1 Tax=Thermithiobacillus tepidarius TaxID=929 RepID=UPI000403261C|nr:cation-translocating P-type ATPase [Thermithiobacillus tepidarius]
MSFTSTANKRAEDVTGAAVESWHLLDAGAVAARLQTDPARGLNAAEAARRLEATGPNEIEEQRRRGPARIFLAQFADFMILVLIAAAVISGIVGEPQDTIAVVVIVVLNAVIGFVQEYRAERAVAALRQMAAPAARVRRGGQVLSVPAAALVPGDVVLLEAGDVVPADLRLTEAAQLKLGEAALTGESQPVEKHVAALAERELPLGDRRNLAYKGTLVSYGRGTGLVVATGMATEIGRIAALLHGAEEIKTPLQKRLARFGRRLALVVLAISAILFAVGLLRGEPPVLMFMTAVSLAVAAIPEALPAVVTVALALGARKMVRKQALIRRLPAVETLGSVTYICSDKTGTLTENRMRVEAFHVDGRTVPAAAPAGGGPWPLLLRALALNNDAVRGEGGALLGDPTELALFEAAAQAGYDKAVLERETPRVAELPFDSERSRMSTLHPADTGIMVYVKGAPERVLPRCTQALTADGARPVDGAAVLAEAERLAADGLRVLAVAYRTLPARPATLDPEAVETALTFLGLVGLMDPPRPEVAEAVALCRTAGITPVMITGDHPATARAIARRLGIVAADDDDGVITGPMLARLPLADFEARVEHIRVYARVNPEQKIKIVQALQDRGEFVAMTGDGVNDAPALRAADIGVAMGRGGTQVAREAAHMVLLDDNFATIVSAVREGRRIFDNIRKFIKYTMTSNSGEIWTLFLAPFLGLPIPLLPIHILWINLVTDGLPGLALAAEPEEKGVMQRPPRPPQESIFAHGMWQHMLWVGLLMGGVTLLTLAWAYHQGSENWQSMAFTVLTLSQMGHVLAIRSERESLFRQGLLSNRWLLGAVLLTFVLQMATLYVPALNPIFKTAPLSAAELILCLVLSTVVFFAVEGEKWLVRRGLLYRNAD